MNKKKKVHASERVETYLHTKRVTPKLHWMNLCVTLARKILIYFK